MNILVLLAAALLPAILLWIYIWKQDQQPEPTKWLARAVLYGVGICIPVALFEMAIERVIFGGEPTNLFGTTIQAFFVAALPEESFKLLALWLILRKNPQFARSLQFPKGGKEIIGNGYLYYGRSIRAVYTIAAVAE